MKLSVIDSEPGHAEYVAARVQGKTVRVYVDGKEVSMVIALDEEAGWLRRYATDAAGNLRVIGDDVVVETVTGKVRSVLDDA